MAKSFSIMAFLGLKSDDFKQGMGGAQTATKGSMLAMGGMVAGFGIAAAAAIAAAAIAMTAAIAKFAVNSLQEFAAFEKGMLEVFTLLPKISKREMGKMQADVLALSREMGILTTDMVPALYQAISAGVPKENVIDFMRVASKAAIAGVTTLETAVDGLTSVINAYGAENMDAKKAADIFFTTVRLGKTTFEELAASLYNVTPVAAAAGISFEDVGAAIAALTAQGVPTAQATTQIRSAIISLTAPSNKARDVARALGLDFEKMTAILAQPGGLKTAMELVMKATGGNMAKLKALLGRIEGVNAVLALSKNGFKSFTDAILAQGRALGAHSVAFERMNQGLSRSWDMLKANVKATMIEIGQALAPIVGEFVPMINYLAAQFAKIPWKELGQSIKRWMDVVKKELRPIFDDLKIAWQDLMQITGPLIDSLKKLYVSSGDKLKNVILALAQAVVFLVRVFEMVLTVFNILKGAYDGYKATSGGAQQKTNAFTTALSLLFQMFLSVANPVMGIIRLLLDYGEAVRQGLVWMTKMIMKITDFINAFGPAQAELYSFATVWKKIKLLVFQIFSSIVYEFDQTVQNIIQYFKDLKTNAVSAVMELKNRVINFVEDIWNSFSTRFPMVAQLLTELWETAKANLQQAWDTIKNGLHDLWQVFEDVFPGIAGTVKKVAQGMIDKFKSVFNFIKDKLGWLATIYEKFTGEVIDMETKMGAEIANIEQNALIERESAFQRFSDERKRREQEMVDERVRKAQEAAAAEEAIEREKMAALQRALISMGVNRENVMKGSLKDLEGWMEKMGKAGEQALAQTTIENEAQLATMEKAMEKMGHKMTDLKKLTGEQLRQLWLEQGEDGRKWYAEIKRQEAALAAQQRARAEAALGNSENERRARSMNYQEMMEFQEKLKDEAKEAKKRAENAAKERAARQKRATADYHAQMKERYKAMDEWLYKQGAAQFMVNGMWVRANNSQEAMEKARHIAKLRRLGEWTDASGRVWRHESAQDKLRRKNMMAQNALIDIQGNKVRANVGAQKQVVVQQNHQIGRLKTQIGMDQARVLHANNYANALARAGQALANSEKRHSNAVIMTFHMNRYAALYAQNLGKAREELEKLTQQAGAMGGGLNLDVNVKMTAVFEPMVEYLRKIHGTLGSIDTTLKGYFVNQ